MEPHVGPHLREADEPLLVVVVGPVDGEELLPGEPVARGFPLVPVLFHIGDFAGLTYQLVHIHVVFYKGLICLHEEGVFIQICLINHFEIGCLLTLVTFLLLLFTLHFLFSL